MTNYVRYISRFLNILIGSFPYIYYYWEEEYRSLYIGYLIRSSTVFSPEVKNFTVEYNFKNVHVLECDVNCQTFKPSVLAVSQLCRVMLVF